MLGGIELLAALGFQPRLQKLEVPTDQKTGTTVISSPTALEAILSSQRDRSFPSFESGNIDDAALYGVHVCELLTPVTQFDVHLEMQEPSLESITSTSDTADASSSGNSGKTDKLSWLDWFDSLGNYKSYIEIALSNI